MILIITIVQGCKKENEDCNPSTITAEIQMRKTSEGCQDIELLWEISFGVSFEFEIAINCGENCSGQQIFYHKKLSLSNENGLTDLHPSAITTRAFYLCDKIIFPSQTLNTRIDDPNPIYAVGDTIIHEFYDPRMCLTNDITECGNNNIELDLPEYRFEYVLTEEDFNCN